MAPNTPDFLPFMMQGRKAEHGGGFNYPEGFYWLEVADASRKDTRNSQKLGDYQQRTYKSKIKMGPNNTQEWVGRDFYDRIPELEQFAGRHMELFVACFGSEEAVNQACAAYNGYFSPEMVRGGQYVVEVYVDKNGYSNVANRYPVGKWQELVGAQAQAAQAAAPAPAPAPMQAPAFTAPAMPMPTAAAAPAPVMPTAVPAMPSFPVPGAAPVATAAPGMPSFPTPPPVPGVPAR